VKNNSTILKTLSICTSLLILTSCSIPFAKEYVDKYPADGKLMSNINYNGNFEGIKEALDEGADINQFRQRIAGESNPVSYAIDNGYSEVAKYLIELGADPNHSEYNKDSRKVTLLMWMAANASEDFCSLLLEKGAKIDTNDGKGQTAISWLCQAPNNKETDEIDTFNLLLKYGAKINKEDFYATIRLSNGTYYDYSINYNFAQNVLQELINQGVSSDVDKALEQAILGNSSNTYELVNSGEFKDEDIQIITFFTAAFGSVETLKLLEEKGCDINRLDDNRRSLLMIAAHYGNLDMVKYLVDRGLNIERGDPETDTYDEKPLYLAVLNNHYDVAEYLIGKGASLKPFPEDMPVNDCLCEAALNCNIEMMDLLISNGYNFSEDRFLESAFQAITSELDKNESVEKQISAIKFLVSKGFDINKVPFKENLDLCKYLVENRASLSADDNHGVLTNVLKSSDCIKYLIENGANPNEVFLGGSVLSNAIIQGRFDAVQTLVENGAEIGSNEINCASECGSENILKYLFEQGVNINLQDENGQTPLMSAAKSGWDKNIEIILEYGADISIKDIKSMTALDYAKEKKNKEIIKLLS